MDGTRRESDGLQRYLADIGPLGADRGQGGKYVVLPPGFEGSVPEGYFAVQSAAVHDL